LAWAGSAVKRLLGGFADGLDDGGDDGLDDGIRDGVVAVVGGDVDGCGQRGEGGSYRCDVNADVVARASVQALTAGIKTPAAW
jgi:hypothetical protein